MDSQEKKQSAYGDPNFHFLVYFIAGSMVLFKFKAHGRLRIKDQLESILLLLCVKSDLSQTQAGAQSTWAAHRPPCLVVSIFSSFSPEQSTRLLTY